MQAHSLLTTTDQLTTVAGKVWFVGAGPGDPELITVKGRALVEKAGAILFAGSLVSEAATRWAPLGCLVLDSKDMTLAQMSVWLIKQARQHEIVVRLQTGDPGLYGALIELVQPLDAAGIAVEVIPGVSSAMASAAAAVESLTLPEVTQTVIFTRVEGRTPMPEGESLEELAKHHTTLCIFLSITLMGRVTGALTAAGWSPDAPVVVVHKASWPGEEKIVRGTVATIQALCREAKIVSQSMIIASPTLGARHWATLAKSKLYDPAFTHRFRRGIAVVNPDHLTPTTASQETS
jgi:precorrin-4/cobalt-precorrin-4 C11-methyltransferase